MIDTCLTLTMIVLLGCLPGLLRAQTVGGAATSRFVSGELAFDYPAGWQASEQSDQEKIVVTLKRAGLEAEINVVMLRLPVTATEVLAAFRSGFVAPYVEQVAQTLEAAGGRVERVASQTPVGGVAAEGTRLLVESDEGTGMGEIYSLLLNERLLIVGFQRAERAAGQAAPVWDQVLSSLRIGGATAGHTTTQPPEDAAPLSNADLKRGLAVIEEIGALTKQVLKLRAEGSFARAIPLAEQTLALAEKGDGLPAEMRQQLIAGSLNVLGEMYRANGDYQRAEPLFQRALALHEQQHGPESDKLAAPLNNLATLYLEQGAYRRAESLFGRALAILEQTHGPDHPQVATALNNLALLYDEQDDFRRAEQLNQRALAIRERRLGPEHQDTAVSLNNLASISHATGDGARAEQLYRRVLAIQEKAVGPDHPEVATALNNLALLYKQRGDFLQAAPLYQRALAINEKALGPEHPAVSVVLDNTAQLYSEKGDYARAEELLKRALAIQQKAFGSEHPAVAKTLSNLAGIAQARDDQAQAEQLYQRALSILEQKVGTEHSLYATALDNLATTYTARRDFAHAAPLVARAQMIREQVFGVESEEVAMSLNNSAMLAAAQGDYERATTLHQRSLSVAEKRLGPEHLTVAMILTNLSIDYYVKGEMARAIALRQRASDIRERHLSLILTTGTEQQKQRYMAMLAESGDYSIFLHANAAPNDASALRLALTSILQRKGRVLDAASEQNAALRRRLRPEDAPLLDELSAVRAQLAALVLKGAGTTPAAEYQAALAKLTVEEERLQAIIGQRSEEYRTTSQPITLERVQAALPANTALVELAVYRPYNPQAKTKNERWGAPRYVAYVLRHGQPPTWAELGTASAIEAAATKWGAALADPARADTRPLARHLDELIMRPVRKLLGDTKHIFLSPDGTLNLVPFAALVDEQERYLVENYAITYLTSGRDLLRLGTRAASRQGPVVLADPQFEASGAARVGNTTPTRGTGTPTTTAANAEGENNRRSFDFSTARFSPLPGTAGEAVALGSLLAGARLLTEAQATEAALKAVKAPSILHIATHGFFLPNTAQAVATESRGGPALGAPATLAENPLLRSGLALAGANTRHSVGGEDGILTALEAASLNLWGTKLVVLSACETGLGQVENGEGVYGLRRALVLAGSESQVMSLWQVSDAATRDLMVAYYRRLQAGEGRTEALRQVQLEMLSGKPGEVTGGVAEAAAVVGTGERGLRDTLGVATGRAERRHPFYWAAFIQSGDWRGLNQTATGQ